MVGLNVALGQELLWREYPTDQRGTYAPKFWDTQGVVPSQSLLTELRQQAATALSTELTGRAADEQDEILNEAVVRLLTEYFKDIKHPIHTWKSGDLGEHLGDANGKPREKLVLLIRGNLLAKYPSTVVYAARARWEDDLEHNKRVRRPIIDHSDENTRTPIFTGTLPPDVTFLGYDLTAEEAKGSPDETDSRPGWFFILEERVGESRFGMDEPKQPLPALATWSDLSWGHLTVGASGYIDGAAPAQQVLEGITWGADGASTARITFQNPMRVAMHAELMLPELEPNP